tara:strand:- start:236 stop:1495 length:1260 start_codon:yes stop_codon:yes gene_type:complete
MKKIVNKFSLILIIVLVSIFAGYENPGLVEIPKKYVHFLFKKIGLRDNFLNKKINKKVLKTHNEKDFTEFAGNSFSVILTKIKSYEGKSASLILRDKNSDEVEYEIFTQDGFLIKKNKASEINLPIFFYNDSKHSAGVKSVFLIEDEYFALMSAKKISCLYATLISLKNSKEIIKSNCLPDTKLADFDALGGAYAKINGEILLTVGVPTHDSEIIGKLSQLDSSIFGKILLIKNNSISNTNEGNTEYSIFSLGHRNPQGLVVKNNTIFSLEHGPKGGDELNIIVEGKNYGWPVASYGTRYDDGKSYFRSHSHNNFQEPLFVFLSAVAPSSLNTCPKNLEEYYKNNNCLMGLSLREMSILVFLLDSSNSRVISVERILLDKRLRHFGLDIHSKLFVDDKNHFYITADNDGLYKVRFDKFR